MKASLPNEPRIVCPKCSTSIKLTESLAAPLIAKTRRQFEQQLADKQSEFTKRESALRKAQNALKKARALAVTFKNDLGSSELELLRRIAYIWSTEPASTLYVPHSLIDETRAILRERAHQLKNSLEITGRTIDIT